MDNKKIGKLIADLRKKQGLTQQELGDKVGVGFRAVSKWERGLTLPDISIINELSKILGISSDELLTGTINKENKSKEKRKLSNKIKVTITIITLILIILSSLLIYYSNKIYVYKMVGIKGEQYYVKGNVIFNKNSISIIVNQIKFKDSSFSSLRIKNYEYDISSNGDFIFRYGYAPTTTTLEKIETIETFLDNININYSGNLEIPRNKVLKNNIILTLRFINEYDEEITQKIEIKLELQNEK